MKVDMTQPWVETTPKTPKFGEVLRPIIEISVDDAKKHNEAEALLTEVTTEVTNKISAYKTNVEKVVNAHTSKKGPVHGETKATIGLSKKENLPHASANDIKNGIYKHEWITPRLMSLMVSEKLSINQDDYMTSGTFPISVGRLLGKVLTNQIYHTENDALPERTPKGQVSYLISSEENYVMFAELGQGRVTNFSQGGKRVPIGVTNVDIKKENIYTLKGQPISLNSLTTSGNFVRQITGLEYGFGDEKGNFYDSNLHPTIKTAILSDDSETQEVEASLFDPTMIYKPNGSVYFRNLNITKHNFNELYVNQNGRYPFNNSVFLSSDDFLSHISNTRLIKQDNIWGVQFDFLSGTVGIADWLPEDINSTTDKVLSKKGYYELVQTTISSVTGFTSPKTFINLPMNQPWGFETRDNFDDANFTEGERYATLFIPIEEFINGFNSLSADNQAKVIEGVNKELLVQVSTAWENVYSKAGVMRIPFYYEVPNSDDSWYYYLDLRFSVSVGSTANTVKFSALNYDKSKRPTIGTNLNLTKTDNTRFRRFPKTVEGDPFHPKVFRGCFAETGGHLTAYVVGHRQYICYYKHAITSVKQWILSDIIPVIEEGEDEKITDVNMFPANRFYADNTRALPLYVEGNNITYLTRARNKHGKYDFGTFVVDSTTFDLLSSRKTESSEITWLEKTTNKNIPILVEGNAKLKKLKTSALVFSEVNGYIGYQEHGFNGFAFVPEGAVEIDSQLKNKILVDANIRNPYPLFFFYEEMLYWSIASRNGKANGLGKDVCVGGIRVDMLFNGTNYVIRSLPDMKSKMIWGKLFEDYPENLIKGREMESFDDVFIVNPSGVDKISTVFVNYPDLDGQYYSFELEADSDGYHFPKRILSPTLNLKKESGYGETCPYVFFGTYFTPFMQPDKFYFPNKDIFRFDVYSATGQSVARNEWMGWSNEQPIFVAGENITVNGQSLLLDRNITIPIKGRSHKGKIFVSYEDGEFEVYSTNDNPLAKPTEPDNAILFAGFWEKINDVYMLNFHAPKGFSDIASQDFINALLPIVDGKQMALNSMGATFPFTLGKLSGKPRQYYFKKS